MRPSRRSSSHGFTLVEMMTVVIIVGVLATLATYGVRQYILSAKTSEATAMIASIKAAEEAYRDETFRYLNVSDDDFGNLYPTNSPGAFKTQWGGGTEDVAKNFRTLGVQADGPVMFGYGVIAADPGEALPEPAEGLSLPSGKEFGFAATSDPSYVVFAKGNVDGDSTFSYVISHSFNPEVYVENEGE